MWVVVSIILMKSLNNAILEELKFRIAGICRNCLLNPLLISQGVVGKFVACNANAKHLWWGDYCERGLVGASLASLSVAIVYSALGLFLARMFSALMFGFDFRLNHHTGMDKSQLA
ncbi:hypothetical protein PVK06_028937 [Gossypium arboreum]|uniref:Uncharacterized protein n=1 Tax=Gossypium arboreum TaxID=29729 RepID=A0ABR0P5A6_GOSAR|nr:hypothetical protein PVK06_028937 [Gossypium arboreum]